MESDEVRITRRIQVIPISPPVPAWFVWDAPNSVDGPHLVAGVATEVESLTYMATVKPMKVGQGAKAYYTDRIDPGSAEDAVDSRFESVMDWCNTRFVVLLPHCEESPFIESKYVFFTREAAEEELKKRLARPVKVPEMQLREK